MAIFRVTVRGRFQDLTDDQRTRLLAELDDHDLLSSGGFTEEGFLAYDKPLQTFTLRVQLRSNADDAEAEVLLAGELRALAMLEELDVEGSHLRVLATDMATVWTADGRR